MKFRFWNREDKHYTVNKEMSVTADGTVLFAGSEMLGEKYVAERFTGITDKNELLAIVSVYCRCIRLWKVHSKKAPKNTRKKGVFDD